jgi:hypothetical protein
MTQSYDIKDLVSSYRSDVEDLERKIQLLSRKIFRTGTLRLALVLSVIALIYTVWSSTAATVAVLTSGIVLFLFLLKYHGKLYRQKHYAETKCRYLLNELKGIEYDFSAFDGAGDKEDAGHRFASDLDLFGENSFFQSINRTVTSFGTNTLADTLLAPYEDREQILQQQKAIAELNGNYELVQRFTVEGMLTEKDRLDTKNFAASFSRLPLLRKSRFWKLCIHAVPLMYLAMTVAVVADIVPSVYFGALWTVTFTLSIIPARKVQKITGLFEEKAGTLKKYSTLFRIIEDGDFVSDELNRIKSMLNVSGGTASKAISQIKYYYDTLELSFSFPVLLFFNPVFLFNVRYAVKIEQWIEKNGKQVESWFAALAKFDSLVSLAIFAHNHPDYIYPDIAERYLLEAKDLGHPLLHRDKCVRNDISIAKRPFFMVVTGANMAGKSTYLRTVGINHILACTGAPVCAAKMTAYPCKLVTNLRTRDSLADNESYFFAELKRLKMIIDRLRNGETLLIILDEILKGTNSIDKQKGSLALMKQLIAMNSNGIIATHDLVLGSLEKEFPQNIINCCFEAEIKDNNLTFSYKINEGIAQNMNATFLMNKILFDYDISRQF